MTTPFNISEDNRRSSKGRIELALKGIQKTQEACQKNADALEKYIYRHVEKVIPKVSNFKKEYECITLEVLNSLRKREPLPSIVERLKEKKLYIWSTNVMKKYEKEQQAEDQILENPYEVEEGIHQCGKCDSKRTISYQLQTSSSDEGTSHFVKCFSCGNRWKMR